MSKIYYAILETPNDTYVPPSIFKQVFTSYEAAERAVKKLEGGPFFCSYEIEEVIIVERLL